jgi:uncharacterized membrane protein
MRLKNFFARQRASFLAGLAVLAPIALTIYLVKAIIQLIDRQVIPLLPDWLSSNINFPGIGLITFIIFTIMTGYFAKNFIGRKLLGFGERSVARMPVIRSVYNALKQIAETIVSQSSNSFQKACLIEYPRKGVWAVAFISTPALGEIDDKLDEGRLLSVFLPTTPNPTSGFLMFIPEKDVIYLDMSIEEAAKLVVSAGLVIPPYAHKKL